MRVRRGEQAGRVDALTPAPKPHQNQKRVVSEAKQRPLSPSFAFASQSPSRTRFKLALLSSLLSEGAPENDLAYGRCSRDLPSQPPSCSRCFFPSTSKAPVGLLEITMSLHSQSTGVRLHPPYKPSGFLSSQSQKEARQVTSARPFNNQNQNHKDKAPIIIDLTNSPPRSPSRRRYGAYKTASRGLPRGAQSPSSLIDLVSPDDSEDEAIAVQSNESPQIKLSPQSSRIQLKDLVSIKSQISRQSDSNSIPRSILGKGRTGDEDILISDASVNRLKKTSPSSKRQTPTRKTTPQLELNEDEEDGDPPMDVQPCPNTPSKRPISQINRGSQNSIGSSLSSTAYLGLHSTRRSNKDKNNVSQRDSKSERRSMPRKHAPHYPIPSLGEVKQSFEKLEVEMKNGHALSMRYLLQDFRESTAATQASFHQRPFVRDNDFSPWPSRDSAEGMEPRDKSSHIDILNSIVSYNICYKLQKS